MQENGTLATIRKRLGPEPVVIIYLPSKSKKPTFSWKGLTYAKTLQPDYIRSLENAAEHGNLAILLGPPSGNLVTIDCDDSEMLKMMLRKFPLLWKTLITYGARGAQIWFRMVEGDYEPQCRKWLVNEEAKYSIEFRGGGGYSLISGIHPKGMPYRRQWGDGILTLTSEQLNEIKRWVTGDVDEEVGPDEIDLSWTNDFSGIDLKELDIVGLLKAVGLNPMLSGRGKDGDKIYDVECPWRKNHSKPTKKEDAGILLNDKQWANFKCHHTSCDGKRIGDVLKWIEARHPGLIEEYSGIEIPEQPEVFEHRSFVYYYKKPIDHSKTLLGNRWLCRGSGAFVVAASGVGKSVWVAQSSILWSIGLPAFGIMPAKPLRILVCQNEDDEGDLSEMSQIIKHLELDNKQSIIDANTSIVTPRGRGTGFIKGLHTCLEEFEADIIMINPYTGFAPELMEPDKTNVFLRDELSPTLEKYNCGCILMHHNPKPQKGDKDKTLIEYSYTGAGWSFMTNWTRAVLAIASTDDPTVFKFIAAKRGPKIGWDNWFKFYCHGSDPNNPIWLEKPKEEIEELLRNAEMEQDQKKHDLNEILKAVPPEGIRRKMLSTVTKIQENSLQRNLDKLIRMGKLRRNGMMYFKL